MNKKLNEEIKRIKRLIKESDISGIDELVFNPLTGPGKEIGFGYDRGKKVQGITWEGHEDHLHIGFTDRNVAMEVIDKADSIGLRTTENPYAKKDPNGKVDRVHTNSSFHYNVFPGTPKVGGGVDISGDINKIKELILWINQKYASDGVGAYGTFSTQSTEPTNQNDLLNKILDTEIGGKKVKDVLNITAEDIEKMTVDSWKMLTDFLKSFEGIKAIP
jgi:hypothetical protein